MHPIVEGFFDTTTGTVTYVIYEREGTSCAIIDSVYDYDPVSRRPFTQSADKIIAFVKAKRLTVEWILETHIHADHITAAPYLKTQLGGKTAINQHVLTLQQTHDTSRTAYETPNIPLGGHAVDGQKHRARNQHHTHANKSIQSCHAHDIAPSAQSHYDYLFEDNETFNIGHLIGHTLYIPGHTITCMAYQIGDAIFVGDALLMPDLGTGRCDLFSGDAAQLYTSLHKILNLPGETRLFVCHDYPPSHRAAQWESTIAEQRAHNIYLRNNMTQTDFINMRMQRDAQLDPPRLAKWALHINECAGYFPKK